KAFLRPARERPNLMVLTRAEAGMLLLEGTHCTGVSLRRDGQVQRATARAEVVLTAGAIASPQLLQLSGIGPGEGLPRLGIPVRNELPGVGANLQDHLQLRLVFKVQGTVTLNQRAATLRGRAAMAAEYALFRTGPLTMAPSQLGAFTRSDPSFATPNLEY